jgi:hypothetical protein
VRVRIIPANPRVGSNSSTPDRLLPADGTVLAQTDLVNDYSAPSLDADDVMRLRDLGRCMNHIDDVRRAHPVLPQGGSNPSPREEPRR